MQSLAAIVALLTDGSCQGGGSDVGASYAAYLAYAQAYYYAAQAQQSTPGCTADDEGNADALFVELQAKYAAHDLSGRPAPMPDPPIPGQSCSLVS